MNFTYLDILEQCFHTKFYGDNKQEVDSFLQLIADDFREMKEGLHLLKIDLEQRDQAIFSLEKKN